MAVFIVSFLRLGDLVSDECAAGAGAGAARRRRVVDIVHTSQLDLDKRNIIQKKY